MTKARTDGLRRKRQHDLTDQGKKQPLKGRLHVMNSKKRELFGKDPFRKPKRIVGKQ